MRCSHGDMGRVAGVGAAIVSAEKAYREFLLKVRTAVELSLVAQLQADSLDMSLVFRAVCLKLVDAGANTTVSSQVSAAFETLPLGEEEVCDV